MSPEPGPARWEAGVGAPCQYMDLWQAVFSQRCVPGLVKASGFHRATLETASGEPIAIKQLCFLTFFPLFLDEEVASL